MKKRFTDIDIWKKPWFRKLSPAMKCAWRYITDNCDNAGVWDADKEAAEFHIGESIDWEGLIGAVNGNIRVLQNEKWYIVDFCFFQYGELKEACHPHRQVIQLLHHHGLAEEKAPEDKTKHPTLDVPINETRYKNLCAEYGQRTVDDYIGKAIDWVKSKGKKPYADYASAAAQYMKRDGVKAKSTQDKCPKCGGPLYSGWCPACGVIDV